MEMFEKASRMKLRFATHKGSLNVEDLWDLSLTQLNNVAKSLNRILKDAEEEDFLQLNTRDVTTKLQFDLVLHILNVKKEERDNKKLAAEKKAEKEKLLAILEQKEDEGLKNLSADEIKKRIDELS